MNNKMTLVESMAALRKQLHNIESNTLNEGLKDAIKAIRGGEEIIPSIIKFWSREPAAKIIKEFKSIEITLPNGTKEIWNATGIKNGEVMYSRASDNAVSSFENVTKSGTVKNITNDLPDLREPTLAKPQRPRARKNDKGEWEVQNEKGEWVRYEKPVEPIKPAEEPVNAKPGTYDAPIFKNLDAAKEAADAEIQAGNAIVKAPDGTVFKSASDIESFIANNYPESAAAMAANPKKSMNFWAWFSKPAKPTAREIRASGRIPDWKPEPQRKTAIAIIALLIMFGLWMFNRKDDKVVPSGGGSSGGASGENKFKEVTPREAAIANASYGDQERGMRADAVDWSEVASPPDQNEFFSRGKDGKWRDRSGKVITDPNIIMAIVKSSKESRMQAVMINPDGTPISPDNAAKEPTTTVPITTANTDVPNPDAIQVDPNFDGKIKSSRSKAR
jgi:hypothetical protein